MARREIPCPHCKKALSSGEKGVWPFCSERCKLLDLGAWAEEKYRVAALEESDTVHSVTEDES